jgi:hypothetical protein
MLRDGIANHGRFSACIKIQKFLKGYKISRKFEKDLIQLRLFDNIEFFKRMKHRMFETSQIYIAYIWRKRKNLRKKIKKGRNKALVDKK